MRNNGVMPSQVNVGGITKMNSTDRLLQIHPSLAQPNTHGKHEDHAANVFDMGENHGPFPGLSWWKLMSIGGGLMCFPIGLLFNLAFH
jgi:hypothetical protein